MKGVSSARMREIDRRAQEEFGIPELLLMEHAGTAVALETFRLLAGHPRGQVLVLAGGGANGGDGLVAARHLDNWGVSVSVVLLADRDRLRGAARTHFRIAERLKISIEEAGSASSWRRWMRAPSRSHFRLVIDALLGTGISGRVREPAASAIRWMNRQTALVLAVDVPSGLSADTGKPCGDAVRADCTVACGLPKIGQLRTSARPWVGRLVVCDISLPRSLRL